VKARIAVAVVLLVIAVALCVAAVSGRGAPWGWRGHQAVVLEAAGTVEVTKAGQGGDGSATRPVAGLFLDAGDELRAGRYSEVRLRTPGGLVILKDGAHVVIGPGTSGKPVISVERGAVDVQRPAGMAPFLVGVDGLGATIAIRAGTDGGEAHVLVDGHGARAWVKSGSAEGTAAGGDENAETGKVLVIGEDKKPRIEDAPSSLALAPVCERGKLVVTAPDGAQLFIGGKLLYPDKGQLVVDSGARAEMTIFGKDFVGNVAHTTVKCVEKAEKPAPPRAPPKAK
jgi:hypothetical protein